MTLPFTTINELPTPCCLVDLEKMQRNIERLSAHIGKLGCVLRPHVKTHKSIEVTQAIIKGGNVKGITVSTLKEAAYFYHHGIPDILYAVGIVPNKLEQAADLIDAGCDLKIVLDNPAMAELVVETAEKYSCTFKVMIEIDTDGHRAGIDPHSDALLATAKLLSTCSNIELHGVMAHAGESYNCFSDESKREIAAQERDLTLIAAQRIRAIGIECKDVSIGSTPTAHFVDNLDGVTEVRAGVYVFFDLVMSGLNVCDEDDIAMSVLTNVIGHQQDKNWVITDAGWMALSRDRGTESHPVDQGYGLVTDISGNVLNDYIVADANQEHGIIRPRVAKVGTEFSHFPLAQPIRILPNHACATAGQFDTFYVVKGQQVVDQWQSISGW
jgi:D-serine deaminase-like pyridoxal phosphate-dependent protein